jgi:hypothetical protein
MLNWSPVPFPTSTPLIVANRVDLAVGLPDDEIWLIAVLRADGYIDEYRIPVTQVLPIETPADVERYMAFHDTIFQLKPGETILHENLLTLPMRRGPTSPEDLTSQINTPTPSQEEQDNFTGTPMSIPTSTPGGSPTPTPLTRLLQLDLAQGLPDSEVWMILVLRTDGKLDEYRIPLEQVRPFLDRDQPDYEGYQAFLDTIFQLKPGETLLFANIANSSGRGYMPPASSEQLTALAETPTPPSTGTVDPSSQDAKPMQLHLPQVGN